MFDSHAMGRQKGLIDRSVKEEQGQDDFYCVQSTAARCEWSGQGPKEVVTYCFQLYVPSDLRWEVG